MRILGGLTARALLVATIVAGATTACTTTPAVTCRVIGTFPPTTSVQRDPAFEAALVAAHNADRAAQHLAPLANDPALADVAAAYATQEAAQGSWGHVCDLFTGVHAYAKAVDENLAVSHGQDPGAVNALFMASPGHRANILDPRVNSIGIGVVHLPDGTTLTVVRLASL